MDETTPRVLDGHTDVLLDLRTDRGGGRSFFERSETGHVDLPRAREGNWAGGFFAVFVPNEESVELRATDEGYDVPLPPPVPTATARTFTEAALADLARLEADSEGELRVVGSVAALRSALADGALAAIPHLEGAAAVEPDRSNLDALYESGVRSIGLTWSRPNAFGHGVPFRYPATPDTGPGLTDAGLELVRACDERGILVDLAHLNAAGFWDVAETSDAPLVFSHGGAHAICPSTRNLTDDQLDAIADSDGLVGVQLGVQSIRPDGDRSTDTPVSVFADHVAYVADRVGVEHVAFGSDFDGCTIPETVGDVTGVPKLLAALRERGFSAVDVRKFAQGNWLRVLEATWE